MKQHQYRITIEHLADSHDGPSSYDAPLQFEHGNHDDIFAVVARLAQRGDLDARFAAALGVGLKLFGEVMLENRDHPLFAGLMPHFGEFMKQLKKGPEA